MTPSPDRMLRALRSVPRFAWLLTPVVGIVVAASVYTWYAGTRILPDTWVGGVTVGGLTRDAAAQRLQEATEAFQRVGIRLAIEGREEVIRPENIGLDLNIGEAVDLAFAHGHAGGGLAQASQRLGALWGRRELLAPMRFDERALGAELDGIAALVAVPRRDVRLAVSGAKVTLLTDTAPGRTLSRTTAVNAIRTALVRLDPAPIGLSLQDDAPVADPASGQDAAIAGRRMIARSIVLQYEDFQFVISRERIGSWLVNEYPADESGIVRLVPGIDRTLVAAYVAGIAGRLNVAPEPPQISTQNGRVTGFTPARVGQAVQEDVLVERIVEVIVARAESTGSSDTLVIPMRTATIALTGLDAATGITELVGRATTPFTGSPKNRISNIKNGVKFLSGAVVRPGEELSTLGTLGTIDDTTGYLPELVIKGDRTTPEYGGGLCQVSTTLFRAVLNAGLPVVARRSHSFRVSYYEKDGNGKVIGPGLDATIYEPDVDFKFRNDMAHPVLIIGYVVGDKVTFELYGTRDGRTSQVIGPRLVTETPPGDPIYHETTDLDPGTTKQIEQPHPGGSTIATYVVTSPDGKKIVQEFKSWYRRWPAQFLMGVAQLSAVPAGTDAPR